MDEKKPEFKVGDIVKWKACFLKSTCWFTNVPIDGKVVEYPVDFGKGISGGPNTDYARIVWCDWKEAKIVNVRNIMLASEPDYT